MSSPVSSLTASRSSSPEPLVQPDHFYGADPSHLPPSPDSEGKTYLSPEDDPLAHRGIPVFKPSMHEFADFEGYMNRVECWGRRSGIVKVVPPAEWTAALPDVKPQLAGVKIKSPIEQFMRGRAGLFRQENMEKRKLMSVREWAELCAKDEFRAPGVDQVGVHNNPSALAPLRSRRKKKEPEVKAEQVDETDAAMPDGMSSAAMASPPNSASPDPEDNKPRNRRRVFPRYIQSHTDWLPPGTAPADYTPEFCAKLERAFWRNCGLGKPAWYGADTMGSLYTDATTAWNLSGSPGVNTPYLYFGMWRATFAWHVEDMDLFSINYIHFGAPKFWYAVPQARAGALEDTMRGYFPKDTSSCPQFLRHKSFLASPTLLAQSAVRPNHLVQHAGEFVITYPRGYHAGFNLGLNCAESVNFALDSWLEEGRRAAVCKCVEDSVRIDVDQLLADRHIDELEKTDPAAAALARAARYGEEMPPAPPEDDPLPTLILPPAKPRSPRKRKPTTHFDPDGPSAPKRPRTSAPTSASVHSTSAHASTSASTSTPAAHPPPHPQKLTLKLGPRPAAAAEPETFPCCLCVDSSPTGLTRVHDLPPAWRELAPAARVHPPAPPAPGVHPAPAVGTWMAHDACARVLPETWVDSGFVFGVDGIPRARWALKCAACARPVAKAHGALIQCAKGKCSKAFHVGCARAGAAAGTGVAYRVVREVEKEVVLLEPAVDAVSEPVARVLKVIFKTEAEALCAQHNPAIVASRREAQQESLRAAVLAFPPLARIKLRVSSGVFEVTLMRVVEERRSVEVLWDAGVVREFKWGSIILGATSLPTMQFPPADLNPSAGPSAYRPAPAPAYTYSGASPQAILPAPSAASHFPATTGVMRPAASSSAPNPAPRQNPYSVFATHPAPTSASGSGSNPAAQAPGHNPYNVFKYEYWPYGYGAGTGAGTSGSSTSTKTANANAVPTNAGMPVPNASTPAPTANGTAPGSHYVNQYYTGAQPWSTQYYRTGAGTGTTVGQAYYPQAQAASVQKGAQTGTPTQPQPQPQTQTQAPHPPFGTQHPHSSHSSAAPNPNPAPPPTPVSNAAPPLLPTPIP
ncbi:JmjC domain, hydroxylase-domain-containing protein, partial [Mycena vulgaris]